MEWIKRKLLFDLRRGDPKFFEPVFESRHFRVELVMLVGQDLQVEVDQFQERLGGGVVVPAVIEEVNLE